MTLPMITLDGRLVDDVELRFTTSGKAVASFRVACSDRRKDGDKWVDGDSTFLTCTAWEQLAESCAESLQKGTAVVVTGKLAQESYEAKDGTNRTVYKVKVDACGPSLRWATATVHKPQRGTTDTGRGLGDDPWAGGGTNDEPPF